MSTRVWICQCLCRQRHCIIASAGEADSKAAAMENIAEPLRTQVGMLLTSGAINPRCGICHEAPEAWHYELNRTRFRSMEEATPHLKQSERDQAAMRALWGDLPRSD